MYRASGRTEADFHSQQKLKTKIQLSKTSSQATY